MLFIVYVLVAILTLLLTLIVVPIIFVLIVSLYKRNRENQDRLKLLKQSVMGLQERIDRLEKTGVKDKEHLTKEMFTNSNIEYEFLNTDATIRIEPIIPDESFTIEVGGEAVEFEPVNDDELVHFSDK